MKIWPTIAATIERTGAAALVTVVDVRGSAPRDAGARMVVGRDGRFQGTIGGGALEWQALAAAQKLFAGRDAPSAVTLAAALGPDLGQCCGGRVTLSIERFEAGDRDWIDDLAGREAHGPLVTRGLPSADGRIRRQPIETAAQADLRQDTDGSLIERFGASVLPVLLFGAGHVGRAVVLALAPLPVTVCWVDGRPDAFPEHVPANCRLSSELPATVLAGALEGTAVLAMTHSHPLDLDIVARALTDDRFVFVGVIGSRTKRRRFEGMLRQAGIDDGRIGRLVCPIGLPDLSGKEPAVIAAGVAAQLLLLRAALLRDLVAEPERAHHG